MENQGKGGCFALIVVALIVFGIIGACNSALGNHGDEDYISKAHEAVPSYLKSPSTAHFVGDDQVSKKDSSEDRTVEGSVDCQNGFGATVRVDYTVTEDKDTNIINVYVQDRY